MAFQQLADLTERLAAIDDKARGGRIEADDWNALVAAVQSLIALFKAREDGAAATLEARFASADHDHQGEVSADWLEPGVMQQLGGGGDVAARNRVSALERKLEGLSRDMARLVERTEDQRREVDRFAFDNIDTRAQLREADDRLSVVDGLSATVGDLSVSVVKLRGGFDEVLDLRERLTDPNGVPLDIAALSDEVDALGELRANLKGVDGELVRLRDIEIRLRELQDITGTGAGRGLDDRLAVLSEGLLAETGQRLDGRLDDRDAAIVTTLDARLASTDADLNARLLSFVAQRDSTLDVRESTLREGLLANIDVRLKDSNAALDEGLGVRIDAAIDAGLAALPTQITTAVKAAADPIELRISNQLQDRFDARLKSGLSEFEASQQQRLDAFSAGIKDLQADIPSLIGEAVADQRTDLQGFVDERLKAELPGVADRLLETLGDRVQTLVNSELSDLSGELALRIDERFTALGSSIDQRIDKRLDDVEVLVTDGVRAAIDEADIEGQLAAQQEQVIGVINSRVSKTEARLRAERSTAIDRTVTTLRKEIKRAGRIEGPVAPNNDFIVVR